MILFISHCETSHRTPNLRRFTWLNYRLTRSLVAPPETRYMYLFHKRCLTYFPQTIVSLSSYNWNFIVSHFELHRLTNESASRSSSSHSRKCIYRLTNDSTSSHILTNESTSSHKRKCISKFIVSQSKVGIPTSIVSQTKVELELIVSQTKVHLHRLTNESAEQWLPATE